MPFLTTTSSLSSSYGHLFLKFHYSHVIRFPFLLLLTNPAAYSAHPISSRPFTEKTAPYSWPMSDRKASISVAASPHSNPEKPAPLASKKKYVVPNKPISGTPPKEKRRVGRPPKVRDPALEHGNSSASSTKEKFQLSKARSYVRTLGSGYPLQSLPYGMALSKSVLGDGKESLEAPPSMPSPCTKEELVRCPLTSSSPAPMLS